MSDYLTDFLDGNGQEWEAASEQRRKSLTLEIMREQLERHHREHLKRLQEETDEDEK